MYTQQSTESPTVGVRTGVPKRVGTRTSPESPPESVSVCRVLGHSTLFFRPMVGRESEVRRRLPPVALLPAPCQTPLFEEGLFEVQLRFQVTSPFRQSQTYVDGLLDIPFFCRQMFPDVSGVYEPFPFPTTLHLSFLPSSPPPFYPISREGLGVSREVQNDQVWTQVTLDPMTSPDSSPK